MGRHRLLDRKPKTQQDRTATRTAVTNEGGLARLVSDSRFAQQSDAREVAPSTVQWSAKRYTAAWPSCPRPS